MHLSNGVGDWQRSPTRQPKTNGLALFAHSSVRQKLNRVSSVQWPVQLFKTCCHLIAD